MEFVRQTGTPAKLVFGLAGRGEAGEQAQFSPKAEMPLNGLCFDDVRTI